MNWRTIDENWKKFVKEFNLESERLNKNYFHGYQDIYKATEHFNEFKIFYENKVNKSTNYGSLLGNSMIVIAPIQTNQKIMISINRSPYWKRLLGLEKKLRIKSEGFDIQRILTPNELTKFFEAFPNTKISIDKFYKHGNKEIDIGQEVMKIETNDQPEKLKDLKIIRGLTIKILIGLMDDGKIKAET